MKTTSFLISKQLKEAGFEAETNFYWYCYDNGREMRHIADADGKGDVEAYDLETLLDALPAFVEHNKRMYYFWLWNDGIGYYPDCDRYSGGSQYDMENGIYEFSDDESLANVAGKMWLILKEKGLIC